MSVMVVSNECIEIVAEAIQAYPAEKLDALGSALLALNYLAFDLAYERMSADVMAFRRVNRTDVTPIQRYKALQSYIYQVSDLEPDYGSSAWALIERCKDALASNAAEIIAVLPAYDTARWG